MSEDLFVKICGISTEDDALLAVGLGADALGFIFAPSLRQVAVTAARDIITRLPHGITSVGVFRDESPQRVVEIANSIGLGAVQLHGHESADDAVWIRERVPMTIKAFAASDPAIAWFEDFGADFLLMDGPSPGSGEVFDWRLGEGVVDAHRMIVSGGLKPDNVAQAIARLRPYGVDVASGVETYPGKKDPRLVREFIVNAREAHRQLRADVITGIADDPDAEDSSGPYDWTSA